MPDAAPARLLRALTPDHHIRFSAVDASALWDGVRRGHPQLAAEACGWLTQLMTATTLLQGRTLFAERLQLLLKGTGRARAVVADSWPDGALRGVLDVGEDRAGDWIQAPGLMQVMRSNAAGQPYVGHLEMVEIPSPEQALSVQVEAYLQQSEQIQASVTLWCDPTTGEAGGLMVEPLPNCPPDRLARLVNALEGLEVVPLWERSPEFLCGWISQGDGYEVLASVDLEYRCRCSRQTLLATLGAFGAEQRAGLFEAGDPMEVRGDYCGAAYALHASDLPPHP